jgi:hypothetical protein
MANQDVPSAPGIAQPLPGTPTHHPDGHSFIGGKAKEMSPRVRTEHHEGETQEEKESEKEEEKCPNCTEKLGDDFLFCPMCGIELGRKGIAKALGIELTQDDISEYFFKGYIVKELELAHGKKGIFKTLLSNELDELDTKMTERFKDQDASQGQWENIRAITGLSYGWIKFDGVKFGETADSRFEYLMGKVGPHLIDIASKKWNLLNRAVQAMLEDPEVIKN